MSGTFFLTTVSRASKVLGCGPPLRASDMKPEIALVVFSLVIPTYNESQNIRPLIRQLTSALESVIDNYEIIVVDDDSPDGTWKIAEELARQNSHLRIMRRRGEKGLATAVVLGWKEANGEILGVMDGDLQHPPEILPTLLKLMLSTHADIVVASRNVAGGGVSEWSLSRRLVSWGAACLATLMLPGILRIVRDPMSGYFVIRRSVIPFGDLRPVGYKILLEVMARGKYDTIVEVPYVFEERKHGASKLGPKQQWEFLRHLGRLGWETGQIGRFFRFCAVGGSGVVVNVATLSLLTEIGGLYYLYSSIAAVETAIMSNFVLNEYWTFQDRSNQRPGLRDRLRRLAKFNLLCAVGAIVNVTVLWVLTDLAGVHYVVSNLVGLGAATLWNYGLNANITWEGAITRNVVKGGDRDGSR